MNTSEKPSDINSRFQPSDQVYLHASIQEDPPVLYTIEKIVIDKDAVKYFLTPKPKGANDWFHSDQLQKP